ncbi:hypothetical protein RB213_007671 [Colletotrichum asianum]
MVAFQPSGGEAAAAHHKHSCKPTLCNGNTCSGIIRRLHEEKENQRQSSERKPALKWDTPRSIATVQNHSIGPELEKHWPKAAVR